MTDASPSDSYWSVDIPGLTEGQAKAIADNSEGLGYFGTGHAVDPHRWLTMHMDRWTVEFLERAVNDLLKRDVLAEGGGLLETYRGWLQQAEPIND
jgi:hypothetical protein